jgi:hypothetical protein
MYRGGHDASNEGPRRDLVGGDGCLRGLHHAGTQARAQALSISADLEADDGAEEPHRADCRLTAYEFSGNTGANAPVLSAATRG